MSTYMMQFVLWLLCCLEVLLCFGLLDVFFDIKKQLNKKKLVAIVVCVLFVGTVLTLNRQLLFFSNNMWLLSMLVVVIFAISILRKHILLIVELLIISFSVIALLDFLFLFVAESLFTTSFWNEIYFRTVSWWGVLIFAITRVICVFLLGLAYKLLSREMDIFILEKIFIPICIVLCIMIRFFHTLLVALAKSEIAYKSWAVSFVIMSCLILILFIVVFLQRSIVLKNENEVMQVRDDIQEKRYLDLQRQGEENKHIVHDMKNHIITLQGLCKANDIDAVTSYLQDMNGMFEEYGEKYWCDNPVINTILNQKIKLAKDAKIICDIQCIPHVGLSLSERELVAVFGNLLDNAIEACQKVSMQERRLNLVMKQRQNLFYLEITNSIHEKPEIKGNKIVTSKEDKNNHGYGLKNVARVVENHQGVMLLEATEQCFKVSISFFA